MQWIWDFTVQTCHMAAAQLLLCLSFSILHHFYSWVSRPNSVGAISDFLKSSLIS